MNFSMRSLEKEWIDLGPSYYTREEYRDCLKKLGQIGSILGGNKASFYAFNNLQINPKSILDVGCGGGQFTLLLAKKYPQAEVLGVDFSEEAIRFANEENLKVNNLAFQKTQSLELEASQKSYDIITATLVCHHMNSLELIDFLMRAKKIAKQVIILNDLHRHKLAYFSYFLIASKLFKNRLITHDGLISIKRGFKKKEWISYLEQAGFAKNQYTITWKFPFRWIITIKI